MIVVVCGSRNWEDGTAIWRRLSALPGEHEDITIIHGACSRKVNGREVSADMLAEAAALDLGCTVIPYSADWDTHGRAAGPIRNRHMLDRIEYGHSHTKPGLVLAFQRNGSRGTQDLVDEARRRGIDVEVHEA